MAVSQIVSIVGAAMILGAFGALQFRRMHPSDVSYLLLNLVGSIFLALAAGLEGLWAFVVLNVVWAAVSLRSLLRRQPATLPQEPEAAPEGRSSG